jgi:two-component system, LuxR family, response regulator FixJ
VGFSTKAKALSAIWNEDTFVYIVDDDPGARESVAALVQSRGMRTKEYPSAEEFLAMTDRQLHGCLVLDVRMKGMGGLDLQEELRRRQVTLPVIVITGFADVPMAVRALQGGAMSFLTKPCKPEDLWQTIVQALEQYRAQRRIREQRRAVEQRLSTLTPEERLVLVKVLGGVPNKRIARDLDIGLRTVELRRSNLMKKMEVESLAELIQVVLRVGSREIEPFAPSPPED